MFFLIIQKKQQRCIKLFYLFIFLYSSLALPSTINIFNDSVQAYFIDTDHYKKHNPLRLLNSYSQQERKEIFFHFLDSLGYFNPLNKPLGMDSVLIEPGKRSLIDTFIINCSYPLAIDSIAAISFPFEYNILSINRFARSLLIFLANRGFPFARLSTSITHAPLLGDTSKSSSSKQSEEELVITFQIDTQRKCVFGKPLFSGTIKTNKDVLAQDMVFRPGQIFSLEKVENSRKRLLSRAYINDVTIIDPGIVIHNDSQDTLTLLQTQKSTNISTQLPTIDTVVAPLHIIENSGMGIDGTIAYQSESDNHWIGLLDLAILNIFHQGESASLFYHGEELLQQFRIALSYPYPFRFPILTSASFGLEIEEKKYGFLRGEFKILSQFKGLWQVGMAIVGHETTTTGIQDQSWYFLGLDFILNHPEELFRDQVLSRLLYMRTGTGIADKNEGKHYRWHLDFTIGTHLPLFKRQALWGKLVSKVITTDQDDTLHQVEQHRIGGHSSIRGYAENQFPFLFVAYSQTEYLFYYNPTGSIYIFIDGGIGFKERISLNARDRNVLLGYGLGIRIPVRFGNLSLTWARNYKEPKGLGRIHVRVQNNLASGIKM